MRDNRFFILLASRQIGKTTMMTIYALWIACFNEDQRILIVANKEGTALEIMSRIRLAYEELPNWLKPGVKEYGKTSVTLANGTRIGISTTTGTAARGQSVNVLILDELAFIEPHLVDDFWKSVYPIVSSSKRSKIFIASTANGTDNLFYKLYTGAENKENDWEYDKILWDEIPGRNEKWKQQTINSIGSREAFEQEFNCEFISNSESSLDDELFEKLKIDNNFKINIKAKDFNKSFVISNNFQNNIYNILAALAVMSINIDITKLDKKVFFNFTTPQGRGDLSRIKINKKNINLIDESYNSNPLSLKSAILNYDKVKSKKFRKYLLLGDMLELGTHSKKLHQSIVPIINKTKIDKIFLKGNYISQIFKKIVKSKRGKVFRTNSQMIKFIKNDLNNNDYLMVKASNATGFNKMINDLKGIK